MTNTGFADSNLSARVRDAMEKIARNIVREEGVTYRYGTVTAIDYDGGKVDVQFPGSDISVPVRSLGIQPTKVGQVVQVASRKKDHFVNGVVGASGIVSTGGSGLVAPVIEIKQYVESIVGDWNPVAGASSYEFQVSANDDFVTAVVFTYQTAATQYTFPTDEYQTGYYVRVRALDGSTPPQAGPWSNIAGPVAPSAGGGGAPPTDGTVPDDSPDVTLVPGIGYLQAKWTEDNTNPDPVAYEVHIAKTSGFTPDVTTFYDVTGGNTLFIRSEPDGSPLQYDTNYYVRLLAFDFDGKALVPGAQAIAQINRVETDDAGNIGINNVSDGVVPSQSPNVKTVTGGIGYLFVTWDHVPNPDTVHYELHLSTVNDFTPTSNTKVGDTPSNFFFIREQGPGALSAPLDYAVTYYVKIIAYDADGYAASFGLQGSGSVPKTGSGDIANGAIVAGSAIIADGAIGNAMIGTAAITEAKIADAQIKSAHIDLLQVNNGHIADLSAAKITAGTITGEEIILNGSLSIIRSSNYDPGVAGWQIKGDGTVEFGSGTFRGQIKATSGTIEGNLTVDANLILPDPSGGTKHTRFGDNVYAGSGTYSGLNFDYSQTGSVSNVWMRQNSGRLLFRVGERGESGPYMEYDSALSPSLRLHDFSILNHVNWSVTGGSLHRSYSDDNNHWRMQIHIGGGVGWKNRFIILADGSVGIYDNGGTLRHHLQSDGDLSSTQDLNLGRNILMNTNTSITTATHSILFQRGAGAGGAENYDVLHLGSNDMIEFGRNDDVSHICQMRIAENAVCPSFDAGDNLGKSGQAWGHIYHWGITNQSSRKNKDNITESDLGLDFINRLKPARFTWKNGTHGRPHYGLIAQDVKAVMDELEIDFGGFDDGSIKWGDTHPDDKDPEELWGLRYNEFISPIIKALQEISARLDAAGI